MRRRQVAGTTWVSHDGLVTPDHPLADQTAAAGKGGQGDAARNSQVAACNPPTDPPPRKRLAIAHPPPPVYPPAHLSLFGGFTLEIGGSRIALPRHARRVIAYLSLGMSPTNGIDRRLLADRLWADSPEHRAAASVRTALWRIRRESAGLVHSDRQRLSLGRDVVVDVHGFQCLVARLLSTDYQPHPGELQSLINAVDLLPNWDEDWLVLAREQLRQRRLMALESAASRLSEQGFHLQATELMLVVIAAEPLRESAHAILIDAHLRQRNRADAHSHLLSFASVLWMELGVHPSPELLSKLGMNSGRLMQHLSGDDRATVGLRERTNAITPPARNAVRVVPRLIVQSSGT